VAGGRCNDSSHRAFDALALERIERFDTGTDYRIPYDLSKDYWLYGRRLSQVAKPDRMLCWVISGCSCGEYVYTMDVVAFLDQQSGRQDFH